MVFGQKISLMRLRHLVWNVSIFLLIVRVIVQHSHPYKMTLWALLVKILSLVFRLSCLDFQTERSIAKAWFAFVTLALTPFSLSPSVET